MVSTLDSESSDPSSNLGGTFVFRYSIIKSIYFLFVKTKPIISGGIRTHDLRIRSPAR